MESNESEYKVVGTKVNPTTYKQMKKICAKKGMKIYEMLQMMCDTIVRYMSDKVNLTPQMERAMSIFEHMEGWKDAYNLADPTADAQVAEATYFVGDKHQKGVRAVHVDRSFMGKCNTTVNVQQILERNICLMFPERYKRLRLLAIDMQCGTLLEVIDKLIDERCGGEDIRAIREGFEDADRSEYGRKPNDSPYKRKMHYDVDSTAVQGTITFTDEDKEIADIEAMDGRPHGYEH